MSNGSARARKRVCEAKGGFRNSRALSKCGSCVDCKCKADPPKCTLYPYNSGCCANKDPKQTPHHIIPKHCFYATSVENNESILPKKKYRTNPDGSQATCQG